MYWHIGLHKTATTWLQDIIFRVHPEVNVANNTKNPAATPLLKTIISSNPYMYCRETATREFNLIQHEENKKTVISAERLSGHPASGHYDQQLIAQRIACLDPDARIILSIRCQSTLIPSIYNQLLKAGLVATLQDLLRVSSWKVRGFDLDAYHFNKIARFYFSLFGRENVQICYFEDINTQPNKYLDKIFTFLDIKNTATDENYSTIVNPSLELSKQRSQLAINYFRSSEFNYNLLPQSLADINKIAPFSDRIIDVIPKNLMSEEIEHYLHEYFQESNRDLSNLLPDLPMNYL
ncbi:sulfotransferase domain-containing protein [Pokkaliibacter sp. MBI-7]|uniref:sulfotransferase domain-containing protein n=1 Tax=Pokkaliibacter sp. MBI-7 TaxID=3040600 RepID=UPI0024482100|nr:sulfotransferase domain-containing protein [Pokkaliibacter sp. MBI-7]MDH2435364.1 sulfotransferase domain-containing protein [Pokkaliibacter sp. MBI-7]